MYNKRNVLNVEQPFEIEWWNVIDLLNQKDIICSHIDNKNKACCVKAKFTNIFLITDIIIVEFTLSNLKRYKNLLLSLVLKQMKNVNYALNQLSLNVNIIIKIFFYARKDKNQCIKDMRLSNVKQPTIKDVDIDKLKYNLWILLDQIPELLKVDEVIIENQPSLKNPKMKSIAETLYNYFLCRGIIDTKITMSPITNVKYISPSNKLKINKDNTKLVLSNSKNKTETYKLTKELGIMYCQQFIDSMPKWKDHLHKYKKRRLV